jgi:hypothetical protein
VSVPIFLVPAWRERGIERERLFGLFAPNRLFPVEPVQPAELFFLAIVKSQYVHEVDPYDFVSAPMP